MQVWIVRHGESEGNKKRIFGKSFCLTEKGESQAAWIRDYLADKCIHRIYSSPLERARQSAETVANGLGVNYEVVDALREIEYGELEGQPYSLAEERYPEVFSIDPREVMQVSYPQGESHSDVFRRVEGWLLQSQKEWRSVENILVVTHSMIAKMIIATLLECPPSYFIRFKIANGSASCVEILDGLAYLTTFNTRRGMIC